MRDVACQRWNDGQTSWRRTSDGGFDPGSYRTIRLPERDARAFVTRHHYAASMPAVSSCYGLVTDDPALAGPDAHLVPGGILVGVAVLSVPMRDRVLTAVFPDLEPYAEALELGRFVLADDVPANGESWFLARVLRSAAEGGLRGVVSFSDPVARYRIGAEGHREMYMAGHCGLIYQATNAVACGRSTPRTQVVVARTGEVLSARTLTKIRTGDSGAAGGERRLVALGARPRGRGEDPRAWLSEALDVIGVVRVTHPGMFRYAFPLGESAKARRAVRIALPATAYPKPDIDRVLLAS